MPSLTMLNWWSAYRSIPPVFKMCLMVLILKLPSIFSQLNLKFCICCMVWLSPWSSSLAKRWLKIPSTLISGWLFKKVIREFYLLTCLSDKFMALIGQFKTSFWFLHCNFDTARFFFVQGEWTSKFVVWTAGHMILELFFHKFIIPTKSVEILPDPKK